MKPNTSDWTQTPSSSTVKAYWYDPQSQSLHIQFKRGSVYRYDNVSEPIYEAFVATESMGQFVHNYLRDQYPTTRIN